MAVTLETGRPVPVRTSPATNPALAAARRLAACREGASLLEFALTLPIVLTLFIGMLEVALMMFVSASVEGALREAARFGITGQIEDAEDRQAAIIDLIERYTFGFVDVDTAQITFTTYGSFNDVGQPEPWTDAPPLNGVYDVGESYTDLNGNGQWDADRGTAGVGASGEVVRYEIDYDWKLITPFMAGLLGDNGVLHMSSSIVVRNEPYDFAADGAGGGAL